MTSLTSSGIVRDGVSSGIVRDEHRPHIVQGHLSEDSDFGQ